ncbi:hypothetical protein QBC43DRAFT_345005 [Cladorrhinum sp. PSN259]|nr:hypothetical protein QBC43DRAFT_345005 [Cladorrhinum sp. PSN259]
MSCESEKPLPDVLQALADLGIVNTDTEAEAVADDQPPVSYEEIWGTTSFAIPNSALPNSAFTGQGFPRRPPRKPTVPKKQPPLFWKAVGFLLKRCFSSAGSLLDNDQALFFADPNQPAIPSGGYCPEQVTNYHLYLFADTMQRANRPTFSLDGSSYFEFLNMYMRNVGEPDEPPELIHARQTLLDIKDEKDRAWEAARSAFLENSRGHGTEDDSASDIPTKNLIDFIQGDSAYQSAWDAEKAAQNNLKQYLKPSMNKVLNRINQLRLADMRLQTQSSNNLNMPVIAIDDDWIEKLKQKIAADNTGSSSRSRGGREDPFAMDMDSVVGSSASLKDLVYYRPAHDMGDYESVVSDWYRSVPYPDSIYRDGPHRLNLAGVWDRSWADLGHPLLDDAAPPGGELTEPQKKFINGLDATLTFLHKPYKGNIRRGAWDVLNLRDTYDLQPDAPASLFEPVYKTTRLIIAWGIEIELTIPEAIAASDVDVRKITLAGMDLPLQDVVGNGNKLIFRGGGDFPILLGAFADLV